MHQIRKILALTLKVQNGQSHTYCINKYEKIHENTKGKIMSVFLLWVNNKGEERSGPVVECLTRDRGVAGSSFNGITALCP